jgi:hypothetical protein
MRVTHPSLGRGIEQVEQRRKVVARAECVDGTPYRLAQHLDLDSHLQQPLGLAGQRVVRLLEHRRCARHLLEREPVAVGIRVVELPAADELLHLVAQCTIGVRARQGASFVCVNGELRKHAHKRMRDVLPRRVRRRLHKLHDGVHRHALCGVEHELLALPRVASHLEEPG